jgi:hypothetical protein
MRYNKEKIEAVKILVPEILELNQRLPENKGIIFEITNIIHPAYIVTFCTWEPKKHVYRMEKTFTVLLSEADTKNDFAEITKKMNEWKELYCKR